MSSTVLAPITKTDFAQTFLGGRTRRECWGAITTDGAWSLIRDEMPGTPWAVIHRETRTTVGLRSNLRDCRWFIAAGHADDQLARLQAHDRGEHEEARDSWCGRC